ncbi:hypothetical protein MUP77_16330 [Candidatus Bathyarchaeota archaeon]|nr:hypothetical protein [Candidatus Bathyarchaeota archaeon]
MRSFNRTVTLLLVLTVLSPMFPASQVGLVKGSEGTEIMGSTMVEEIMLQENGTAQIALSITVSNAKLADVYRRTFGAPADCSEGDRLPIPEFRVESTVFDESTVEVPVPIREEFYRSILKEQLLSLGINASITDSWMIPRAEGNEFLIEIRAVGIFEGSRVVCSEPKNSWAINIGPLNTTGLAGLVLTKLTFAQTLLGALPEEQIFESHWHTRIELPDSATQLDCEPIAPTNWTVDFGEGSQLTGGLSLENTTTFLLEEITTVTEKNITSSPEYLLQVLSNYKRFQIEYLADSCPIEQAFNERPGLLNTNWNYNQSTGWVRLPDIPLTFHYASDGDSLDLSLVISPKIKADLDVGWQFYTDWRFPFVHLQRFWAKLSFSANLTVRMEANATLVLYDESWPMFRWSIRYPFYYGVPGWLDLVFSVNANLLVEGEISFNCEAVVDAKLVSGVNWDSSSDWSRIDDHLLYANVTDFAWQLEVEIRIRPSISFRVEVLFYSAAGPFVEFEPYLEIKESLVLPNKTILWEMTIGFNLYAGVTFNGWLKNILGLNGWSWQVLGIIVWHWNGSWPLGSPGPPTEPFHELSIVDFTPSSTTIQQNNKVDLDLTIRNNGDYSETTNVSILLNKSLLADFLNVDFGSSTEVNLRFDWDTMGVPPDSYVLDAFVVPVAGERTLEDNQANVTVNVIASNDLAILKVETDANETRVGQSVQVTIKIKNQGEITDDAILEVNSNNNTIYAHTFAGLMPDEEVTLTFAWNTTGLPQGKTWTLWGNLSTTEYDINLTNNILYGPEVTVYALYDLNKDRGVDILDMMIASYAFGSSEGEIRWNPLVDANGDRKINILDLVKIANSFCLNP